MDDIEEQVATLIQKAVDSGDKDEAMRYTQAALNAAHAAQVLADIKRNATA